MAAKIDGVQLGVERVFIGMSCNRIASNVSFAACDLVSFVTQNAVSMFCPKESKKVVERLNKQQENLLLEVTERTEELHNEEFKLPQQKHLPCFEEKDACLKCYKKHVKDPLKCASFVKDFADCARRVRLLVGSADK